MATNPIVTQPLKDLVVAENAANTTLNLLQYFDDPFTTGQVARFVLGDRSLGNNGVTDVLLFDQADEGAPQTVENFINYVNDGDYANSIIHRSIPDFVIQGGGFTVENLAIEPIPTDPPVANEFSADRSNVRGTIAMAKLGSDPNSATSQWFFNLADNSANLDSQNSGFTVFGEVLSEEYLATVDAIAELPVFDGSSFFGQPALTDLPLNIEDTDNPTVDDDSDLVRFNNVTLRQEDELEFEVVSNSNPDLVNVTVDEGKLDLDYAEDIAGEAEIIIRATDLLGDSVEETFEVTVTPNLGSTVYRFLNQDTGTHLYTTSEAERQNIIDNLPNYTSEGKSYVSVDPLTGDPEPQTVYRFLNRDTGTHLYTTSEVEKESVEENLSNFNLESESFAAYEEQQPGTIPVYRFYNTETGAHFYTPSVVERDFVRENLLNYDSEGIAYYAFGVSE
ncbi:peptidylprolyl isomerase [Myxosarcina sp. GI1]|uniref:peptidylprolyl isomerase n=1 Tax=Myxosarcina sp. GI1 TaxID=1541065 RepID=UPI00068E3E45|nr:peptidylprolyl isomerase [Myxosarcina sp. GI1]